MSRNRDEPHPYRHRDPQNQSSRSLQPNTSSSHNSNPSDADGHSGCAGYMHNTKSETSWRVVEQLKEIRSKTSVGAEWTDQKHSSDGGDVRVQASDQFVSQQSGGSVNSFPPPGLPHFHASCATEGVVGCQLYLPPPPLPSGAGVPQTGAEQNSFLGMPSFGDWRSSSSSGNVDNAPQAGSHDIPPPPPHLNQFTAAPPPHHGRPPPHQGPPPPHPGPPPPIYQGLPPPPHPFGSAPPPAMFRVPPPPPRTLSAPPLNTFTTPPPPLNTFRTPPPQNLATPAPFSHGAPSRARPMGTPTNSPASNGYMAGQPKGDFESFLSQGGTGQTPQGQSAVWESPSASFTKTGQSSAASSGVARKAAEAKGRDIGAQRDIDVWLQRKGKVMGGNAVSAGKDKEEATAVQSGKTASRCISIGEAQSRLRHVLHVLAAVQGEVQQLGEMKQTADTPTWQAGVARLQRLKETYLETKQDIDLKELKDLTRKVEMRRKKRERKKQRKEEEKEAEQQLLFERAHKHALIDQWLDQIQQEDRNKQEMKKMKETADKTLSKVRREIREARKMLDTISRLQKLRAVRSDTAEKRGQTFPPSMSEHFTAKTTDLTQLLCQQIDSYEKEEAALKLIVETEKAEAKEKEREEKRQKEREERQREIQAEQRSLFGDPVVVYAGEPMQPFVLYHQQAQYDLASLQNIRHDWDRFLVTETTPMASRIPDGWVAPEAPSSSVWASTLLSQSD